MYNVHDFVCKPVSTICIGYEICSVSHVCLPCSLVIFCYTNGFMGIILSTISTGYNISCMYDIEITLCLLCPVKVVRCI